MTTSTPDIPARTSSAVDGADAANPPPFGVNEMRLRPREWGATILIVIVVAMALPCVWKTAEPFPTGADYRIPYALSKDYWLYERRLDQDAAPEKVLVLGDSVVWGEYVRPDGTLSHFLNQEAEERDRFLNCGVNGMFPLALEGLVRDYGDALQHRRIILHCNVLWMTSPKADLSDEKEADLNHSRLVPQFFPRVPSYHADINERLSATIERHVDALAWSGHLQNAYYDQRSIAEWTLLEDGREPPGYPHAWRNPLEPLKAGIPGEPALDTLRGPGSLRHKPWDNVPSQPVEFDWVELDQSAQWKAFRRTVALLRSRADDVLIIVGPFNEHMIAASQRPVFERLQSGIAAHLALDGLPVIVPETLPSDLYADASHPLTDGYALLARRIYADKTFQEWLSSTRR